MKIKKDKKLSNFYSKSFILTYRILVRLNSGLYPKQIARQLSISNQLVHYHIKKLEGLNYVKKVIKSSITVYELTDKGKQFLTTLKSKLNQNKKFSIPMSEDIRTHNFIIKYPILKDESKMKFEKTIEMNNWSYGTKRLTYPLGITIKKTTNNVIVYLHQFRANDFSEYLNYLMKSLVFVYTYLKERGILIDVMNGKTLGQHLALTLNKQTTESLEKIIGKRLYTEVNLGRTAKSVYPTDLKAKAWVDRSLGTLELETNDMMYLENFILMPERVTRFEKLGEFIIEQQYQFSKNLEKHMEVLNSIGEAIKELSKTIKELKK